MSLFSALISPAAARQYRLSLWLHGRALGLVFVIAFASLGSQIEALVGNEGIVPAAHQLAIASQHGSDAIWHKPTLAWLDASDGALLALAAVGVAAGGLLCVGIVPALALGACVASYLSLLHVGGPFTRFQWDILLIEAGFAALPATPLCLWHHPRRAAGSRLGRHLTSLLLVKLMFLSGWVKLASGDPAWADGTALLHHYQTQPLPNPISWWMHHLPSWSHRLMCGVMFAIELLVPALALLPNVTARRAAAGSFSALMLAIIATGNYGFFNLLVLVSCLPLLDDGLIERALRRVPGGSALASAAVEAPKTPSAVAALRIGGAIGVAVAALFIILWSALAPGSHAARSAIAVAVALGAFRYALTRNRSSRPLPLPGGPRQRAPIPYGPLLLAGRRRFADTLAAFGILGSSLVFAARVFPAARPIAEVALEDVRGFHMFNAYGLFAVMTRQRPEIVIEGSADGVSWRAYELPYKPGALSRAPPIVIGHMPRLDWQLWFAALAGRPTPWVMRLLERVKAGDRAVLGLFAHNPFPDAPPRHVRAWLYDYRFSSPEERTRSGRWWTRESPRSFAALPDG